MATLLKTNFDGKRQICKKNKYLHILMSWKISFDVKLFFSIYAYLGNHVKFSMGLEILFYIDSSSPYNTDDYVQCKLPFGDHDEWRKQTTLCEFLTSKHSKGLEFRCSRKLSVQNGNKHLRSKEILVQWKQSSNR